MDGTSSSSDTPQSEQAMEGLLNQARASLSRKQIKPALSDILAAIDLCRCNKNSTKQARHGKDKSCHLKQFVNGARSKDPDAIYEVAKTPCSCGFAWPSCSSPKHLEAVDLLTECLETDGHYASALATGLGLVRLRPSSAAGYCRVAKTIRLLLKLEKEGKKAKRVDPKVERALKAIEKDAGLTTARLYAFMKRLIQAGLNNTSEKYRNDAHDEYDQIILRMAYSLKLQDSLRDPAAKLPLELVRKIFSYLDTSDAIRSLRVSKKWNRVIKHDTLLWGLVVLGHPRNPGHRVFATWLRGHQGIRSLVIHEVADFGLSAKRLYMLLFGLPNLQRLVIHTAAPHRCGSIQALDPAPNPRQKLGLIQLSLDNYPAPTSLMGQLLQLSSETLEVLDLIKTGGKPERAVEAVRMPKLRRLQLNTEMPGRGLDEHVLRVPEIVESTPSLEAFYLNGFLLSWTPGQPSPKGWLKLRHAAFGASMDLVAHTAAAPLAPATILLPRLFPPMTDAMEKIEILALNPMIAHNYLFTVMDGEEARHPLHSKAVGVEFDDDLLPKLPKLELFRSRCAVDPELLGRLLAVPAASEGTLTGLELAVEQQYALRHPGLWNAEVPFASVGPAEAFAWARSKKLEHLGLYFFNYSHLSSMYGQRFDGQPFLDWLEKFPALKSVAVYPDWPGDGVMPFTGKLILHPQVKTIYQDSLRKGYEWDEAALLALQQKVNLFHCDFGVPYGPSLFKNW
ncbi:hypothetical protein QBC40DRAFT_264080 [Triangularia verruculosa]|uniref:F-box domain-containing protein n=1 Tax=Triangularia verruculosa TaxID=2587418 RepID=A0AAN7AY79_9PEZI|nr:hypothetical protein QBC40DRAFT_264080 [Triangularia verruculosa]